MAVGEYDDEENKSRHAWQTNTLHLSTEKHQLLPQCVHADTRTNMWRHGDSQMDESAHYRSLQKFKLPKIYILDIWIN